MKTQIIMRRPRSCCQKEGVDSDMSIFYRLFFCSNFSVQTFLLKHSPIHDHLAKDLVPASEGGTPTQNDFIGWWRLNLTASRNRRVRVETQSQRYQQKSPARAGLRLSSQRIKLETDNPQTFHGASFSEFCPLQCAASHRCTGHHLESTTSQSCHPRTSSARLA